MIYYLTGQPGSGKTTLGEILTEFISYKVVHIDGDAIRKLFKNTDFSESGRRKNVQLVHDIAYFLNESEQNVVISMVSPFKDLRDDLKNKTKVKEIYVHTTDIRGREEFAVPYYEPPTEKFFDMDTTGLTPEESFRILKYKVFLYLK
jgi:adenylylsulfate kinase